MIDTSKDDDNGERRLVCAILWRACQDAMYGSGFHRYHAYLWLSSGEAKRYAQWIGFDRLWPPTEHELHDFFHDNTIIRFAE